MSVRLFNDEAAEIGAAILKQAVEDYRLLLARGVDGICTSSAGNFSRREIEEFFRSDLCDTVISVGLGLRRMTGPEFLKRAAT